MKMLSAIGAALAIVALGYLVSAFLFSSRPTSYTSQPSLTASAPPTATTTANETSPDWQATIQAALPENLGGTATTTTALTPTQRLAQDILTTYLNLKQDSQTGGTSAMSIQELVAKDAAGIRPPQYDAAQFTHVPETSGTTRAYASAYASILSQYVPIGKESDLELLQSAPTDTQDPSVTAELAKRTADYGAAVQGLLAIPVPESAVPLHVRLLNAVSAIASSTGAMSKLYTDPLTALAGVETYQNAALEFASVGSDLNAYFQAMKAKYPLN